MRILITGATGYLGSHLCHALIAKGHELLIVKRANSDVGRIRSVLHKVKVYDAAGGNPAAIFTEEGGLDAVIHTATCYGRRNEAVTEIFEANVRFPLGLLEASARHGTGVFINTDTALPRELNAYTLSKAQFAEWGRHFAAAGGVRFVNVRLEHFFGPGDDSSKFTTHVVRSCLGNVPELKLTPGEQVRDFIYIDNVVEAYELLLEKAPMQPDLYQEYDLGSGAPVSVREFSETVRKLAGSDTRLQFGAVPYRQGEIMRSVADTSALNRLGWRCRTELFEGIRKTIEAEKQARAA